MIKGIHHVSMKCGTAEDMEKVRDFYLNTLGLAVRREWAEGLMIDTGCGLIEIFTNASGVRALGAIRHLALLTDSVDETAEKVRQAGYEVFVAPNDKVIPSSPPYMIRMAFCFGPLGEQIEFFQEKE